MGGEFERLYERHGREVWALAFARRLDADLARDVMQEAFLRLWRKWQAGEAIDNPRAWLMRVARNLAEDQAKSAFHRNGTQPAPAFNGVHASDRSPLEKLEHDETFALVRDELKQLSSGEREVLSLRYSLDYDAEQIAELLSTTVTAVHMRLSRARQRLAERLTARGVTRLP